MAAAWDQSIKGVCGNEIAPYLILEGFGLVIDLAIVTLPIFYIKRLHIRSRTKVYLSSIFGVGSL